MQSLVSVIVPIYNVENYIEKCLQSILSQSYENLEVLLVDDGTKDNSIAVIEMLLDERCRVLHKENGGLSSARNYGILHAHGDYIFFVDSDDWLEVDAIETLMKTLEKYDADIVQGSAKYCYPNLIQIDGFEEGFVEDPLFEYFKQQNIKTYVWNKLYKHEVIKDIIFQEGYVNEDVIFTYQVMKKHPRVYNINHPIYNYIQRETSIVHQSTMTKRMRVFQAHDYVLEDCKNQMEMYNFALFHKYISCIYIACDAINGDLTYSKEEWAALKRLMSNIKNELIYSDLKHYIEKNKKIMYMTSNISMHLTAWIIRLWRKKR